MKEILLAFMALFLITVSACAQEETPETEVRTESLTIINQDGQEHFFNIEIADTPEAQRYGLMYRKELPKDSGMLFVFPEESARNFWMQNTFIPLDMLFIKKDGLIHHIHKNAVPHDLTHIPSNGPVLAVLEINGGLSDALNFQSGSTVYHKVFVNELAE
jgi:uncharacterized protein